MPISALVAGHLVLDIKKYANGTTSVIELGGPPAYAAISAKSLGFNVDILSKVGTDFPEPFLEQLSVNSKYIKKYMGNSTKFELSYSKSTDKDRQLRLLSSAPKISEIDFPPGHKWDIGIISPVMNEITTDLVYLMREACSLLCLDPQGFCRHQTPTEIVLEKWWDKDILNCIDIIKPSIYEGQIMTGRTEVEAICRTFLEAGPSIVLITAGSEGCYAASSENSKIYHAPAFPTKTVIDETGAGDCFLAIFSCYYQESHNLLMAVRWATAASSFLIESKGPQSLPTRKLVENRANMIEIQPLS